MNALISERSGNRFLIALAALVIVIAGARAAASVILPCLVAVLLAAIGAPLQRRLEKAGVRSGLAVAVTMLVAIALLAGAFFLVTATVNDFAKSAPGYVEELTVKVRVWLDGLREKGAYTRLERAGFPVNEWLSFNQFDGGAIVDFAGGLVGGTVRGVASALSQVLLVLVMMLFLLLEASGFGGKLRRAFPGDRAVRQFANITREMQRYLAIKTFVGVLTGVVVGVWVAVLGVDFPVLWGVVAFALNYIPVIGSIIAAIPAVLLSLVELGPGRATFVALGYIAVNLLIGNILEPHLMGRRFGLSAFVICIALLFWGWLWGPVGMLLSVPLTMIVKIALEHNPDWRWLAVLIGPSTASASARAGVDEPAAEQPAGEASVTEDRAAARPPSSSASDVA